ncbi:HupE/UreJ family protein [Algoriphagus machipongonensis]|uniref:Membrane protein n=1 Tax=Algoriphagus machipongonensis TaxID=388413 RepID=A3HT13_9BACT|nr:HupE/UreJ family protein [Algoriphagus machipongonensis]EAZ82981.1 membrane protein [Algoriphagus machipongonensis]
MNGTKIYRASFLFLAFFIFSIFQASAHKPNQNYVYLSIYEGEMDCRVELKKSDIEKVLGYSFSQGEIPEPNSREVQAIVSYIVKNLKFSSNLGEHALSFETIDLLTLKDDDFLLFNFTMSNMQPVPSELEIYDQIFVNELGNNHESLLHIERNWKTGVLANESLPSLIYGTSNPIQTLNIEEGSVFTGFMAMVKSGIYHIWIGLDHILFLIALLIPSVIIYRSKNDPKKRWLGIKYTDFVPESSFKAAFLSVVKIITIFTLAHSVTLSLAALEVINLPSRLVESIIAISIAMAAFHNIVPFLNKREWLIILVFGLFHGFGFASVLAEQSRGGEYLVYSLVGFNFGVEIGQLAIIIVAFPILFLLSRLKIYNIILVGFSILLMLISTYWIIERAFGYDLKLHTWLLEKGIL